MSRTPVRSWDHSASKHKKTCYALGLATHELTAVWLALYREEEGVLNQICQPFPELSRLVIPLTHCLLCIDLSDRFITDVGICKNYF